MQLAGQARDQARLIRSGAAGELTEADVERMAAGIAAAASARLDAAAPSWQTPSADPELQATRREVAQLMAAAGRQVDAELREAWRTRQEKRRAAGGAVRPVRTLVICGSPGARWPDKSRVSARRFGEPMCSISRDPRR